MSSAAVSPTGGNPALTEKIALVTGAYGDIGQHTVLGLARAGATVIAAGRDPAKLEQLAQNAAAQVPGAEIETLVVDLADLSSIQQAAQTALATERPVDVLVNNAAVMPGGQRQATRDGFELAFGTNHLGHYALTGHLLPALLTSPEARVISICAGPSNQRLDTSDLNSEQRYRGGMRTYMASKLANAVFAQELARRVNGTTLKSLTVFPGTAATGVQRNNPFIGWLARYLFAPVGPVFGPGGPRQGTAADIRPQVEANLQSLGLDRLDVVYLRIGMMTVPHGESLAERFQALAALRGEGLIRHLGISNVDTGHLAEARAIAPVAAVQNNFHLGNRDETAVLEACTKVGIAFIPFFPLGGGRAGIDHPSLAEIAARHQATTPQIALAWLLALSPVALAIPGTGSVAHLQENLAARSIALTPDDLAELA